VKNRLRTRSKRQPKSSIKSARLPSDIEVLRAQVRQIEERHRHVTTALPFGLAGIDARLPAGGLALGALHEVAVGGDGAPTGRRLPSSSPVSRRGRKGKSCGVSTGPISSPLPSPRPT
jgi:protein ImuA